MTRLIFGGRQKPTKSHKHSNKQDDSGYLMGTSGMSTEILWRKYLGSIERNGSLKVSFTKFYVLLLKPILFHSQIDAGIIPWGPQTCQKYYLATPTLAATDCSFFESSLCLHSYSYSVLVPDVVPNKVTQSGSVLLPGHCFLIYLK